LRVFVPQRNFRILIPKGKTDVLSRKRQARVPLAQSIGAYLIKLLKQAEMSRVDCVPRGLLIFPIKNAGAEMTSRRAIKERKMLSGVGCVCLRSQERQRQQAEHSRIKMAYQAWRTFCKRQLFLLAEHFVFSAGGLIKIILLFFCFFHLISARLSACFTFSLLHSNEFPRRDKC
jgi:hypothetical protein